VRTGGSCIDETPYGIKEYFMDNDLEPYLKVTSFIDYDQPEVIEFAERVCAGSNENNLIEKAVRLYYAVRDEIRYDPYDLQDSPDALKASTVLKKGSGYCVAKAVVLAAVGRQQGIPSRLGFADVRNHLSTPRLRQLMGTDLFLYHGYTEFFLDDKWVKATPAFNLSLCQLFQVKPLEFNGRDDSIFHECNAIGQKHMQYIRDHGSFADLPFEKIFAIYRQQYPLMFEKPEGAPAADFHKEADEMRQA
jgi:transglutaminase-like putative cysteine protease